MDHEENLILYTKRPILNKLLNHLVKMLRKL